MNIWDYTDSGTAQGGITHPRSVHGRSGLAINKRLDGHGTALIWGMAWLPGAVKLAGKSGYEDSLQRWVPSGEVTGLHRTGVCSVGR